MNENVKKKLDAFRNEFSQAQADRVRLGAEPTAEEKARAQKRQNELNAYREQFYKKFSDEERREIQEYFFEDLGPRVIQKEPEQLDPQHPERVREVEGDDWEEYFFLREYFGGV
jgi:capsule polysaccharide export protein KpsE/RkpR